MKQAKQQIEQHAFPATRLRACSGDLSTTQMETMKLCKSELNIDALWRVLISNVVVRLFEAICCVEGIFSMLTNPKPSRKPLKPIELLAVRTYMHMNISTIPQQSTEILQNHTCEEKKNNQTNSKLRKKQTNMPAQHGK